MLRRISMFLASVMMMLAFVGCADTTNPRPDEKTADEEYAEIIRSEAPELKDAKTETLVKNAELVCDSFDRGLTFNQVYDVFTDAGFEPETIGTLVGGAILYKCPEHEEIIRPGVDLSGV